MRASVFGNSRHGTRKVQSPWGRPIPQRGSSRGSTPRGSSTRKPTPNPALWSMSYPANKPSLWPMEEPKVRADLGGGGPTQAVADRRNAIVNKAFQRGGYAG